MSPEQFLDMLECGNAQENWQCAIRMWRHRASEARSTATQLLADALDAQERAAEFDEDGRNFDAIARALENAPVTFPVTASAGEAGTAATVKQGAVHEHATAESGDAQTPGPSSRERK